MPQLPLFDGSDQLTVTPLARKSDPETSHIAARKIVESGKASAHRRKIVAALRDKHGLTFGEIAKASGLRDEQVWRRMGELETAGLIYAGEKRICTIRGTSCRPWFAV